MTVLSYFAGHEQLEMQKVNKRLHYLVAMTQESRRFRVPYFTKEYTDTRKLRSAHQNLGYSPRIRFLLSALYFAVSRRHRISLDSFNVLQYIEENKMRSQSLFHPYSDKYVQFCAGDEFMIHLNLKALLMEENAISRELKAALRMANLYLEKFLQINNGIVREESSSETFGSRM